jgi:hypothetical protein
VTGRARRRAGAILDTNVEVFIRAGCHETARIGPLEVRLEAPAGGGPVVLRMTPDGRIFGGSYGLEISTAGPVLPRSRGLRGRGSGVVRLSGVGFRARRRDPETVRLARVLSEDRRLRDALKDVHFERIRVEPDGTPVIRHMGGSVVWILFPPLVRAIPLVDEQAKAALRALDAFARAGRKR